PNLPGIAGMAAALSASKAAMADRAAALWALTGRLRDGLAEAGVRVLGHPTHRIPHIVTWIAPGVDAETLLMTLEDRGLLCSTVPIGQLGGGAGPSSATGITDVTDVKDFADATDATDVAVRFGLWPGIISDGIERVLEVVPPAVRALAAIGS